MLDQGKNFQTSGPQPIDTNRQTQLTAPNSSGDRPVSSEGKALAENTTDSSIEQRERLLLRQELISLCRCSGLSFAWKSFWLKQELKEQKSDRISEALNSQDRFSGDTVLHQLIREDASIKQIRWALKHGANPNMQNKAGESALVLALKTGELSAGSPLVRELLRHGAAICLEDKSNLSAFSIILEKRGLLSARELASLTQEPLSISETSKPALIQSLGLELLKLSENQQLVKTQKLRAFLEGLQDFSEIFAAGMLDKIVNTRDARGVSALHFLAANTDVNWERHHLLQLGANPNAQTQQGWSYKLNQKSKVVMEKGASPLHIAAQFGESSALVDLLEFGADRDLQDADGDTPVRMAAMTASRRAKDKLLTLIRAGANLSLKNLEGKDFFSEALGWNAQSLSALEIPQFLESREGFTAVQAARFLNDLQNFEDRKLISRLYQQGGQLSHVRDLLNAWNGARNGPESREQAEALARLLPHLFYFYDSSLINPVLDLLDRGYEGKNPPPGEYESDLLALLGNPQDPNWDTDTSQKVILALRSLGKIPPGRSELSWQALNNWARIGQLCFSFTKWRFEALRAPTPSGDKDSEQSSLLERYGFERAPERLTDRAHDGSAGFGAGFLLRPGKKRFQYSVTEGQKRVRQEYDSETHVEFRRAYLLVSNPQFGTLIIRNSSPVFGRDSLQHAAYYSKKAVSSKRLEELSAAEIQQTGSFEPVISLRSYRTRNDHNIRMLLDQLTGLKDDFSAWKFDTKRETAWWKPLPEAPMQLSGGHYSRGFKDLVNLLSGLYYKNKELGLGVVPDLAFVHPDFPAWSPYEFGGTKEKPQTRLRINEKVLRVLQKMANSDLVTAQEFKSSSVHNFFQQAGFEKEAELVLLAPE